MADDKNRKTIADYVGDVVALESHIEEALDRQLSMAKEHPQAGAAVQRFHDMVKQNRDALKQHQAEVGSTGGNPIKEVGSTVLGVAAGLIDKIRTEGVSKALRDDYTAFNHAAIGYTMLHTTALALGDQRTADVATRGLRGYASAVQEINHLIGDVVTWELQRDRHQLSNPLAAAESRRAVDQIWKETATSGLSDPAGGYASPMEAGGAV
jgi:ferritin-like metal-binding protein YciE